MKPTNPNANTHSKASGQTLTLLCDTLVRHSCGKLFWALLCDTLVMEHSHGILQSCGAAFGRVTPLWCGLVGHSCGTHYTLLSYETLLYTFKRDSCRTLLLETFVGRSRVTILAPSTVTGNRLYPNKGIYIYIGVPVKPAQWRSRVPVFCCPLLMV